MLVLAMSGRRLTRVPEKIMKSAPYSVHSYRNSCHNLRSVFHRSTEKQISKMADSPLIRRLCRTVPRRKAEVRAWAATLNVIPARSKNVSLLLVGIVWAANPLSSCSLVRRAVVSVTKSVSSLLSESFREYARYP